jgi:hypothetical protein
MSQSFRGTPRGGNGGGGGNTCKFDEFEEDGDLNLDNSSDEAAAENPPMLKLAIGICEFVFGFFSNCVQVTTTTIAIISMILGSLVALLGLPDIVHRFPWYALIGMVIACAIQLFLHKNAQPMSSTLTRLRHIQNFHISSVHSLKDVQNALTVNTLYFIVALGADIISDATFINLFTHNAFVILFWIVFLTGSSTLLLYDGATRIWGAIEDLKDYHAYHQVNDLNEDA